MFSSLLKVMPILTLLGVSASAQNIAANQSMKSQPMMQSAAACGVNENKCCYARSCECALGGAMEVDFLYWRAANTGFAYAYEIKDVLSTSPNTLNIGSLMRLPAHWDPGFRVGFGWNTDSDRWDVFADWTWFKDHSKKSHSVTGVAGSNLGFHGTWPIEYNTGADSWQSVHASWHLQHNAFDLELGRAFYITKSVTLRPHFGVRGGWINQRFKSVLSDRLITIPDLSEYDFHGKNKYWGVGPRVGIQSKWYIDDSHWSIFGKASTALLLGKTQTRVLNETIAAGADTLVVRHDVTDHFSQAVPNLQLFLGLDWGSCLDCNKYYLGINAGWEMNYYWNQFNLAPLMFSTYDEPIPVFAGNAVSMEGVTINMHFDF